MAKRNPLLDNPFFKGRKGKRKRTKAEAKRRIDQLPNIPGIPVGPPVVRAIPKLGRIAKEGAKVLVDLDPFNRLTESSEPQPLPITRLDPESFIPATTSIPRIQEEPITSIPIMQEEPIMTPREELIQTIVNDPLIEITEAMLPIINDPSILMNSNGELVRNEFAEQFRRDKLEPKRKRKPSKYQKELGKQLKMLKKKHPRTKVTALMKRAHRATRKALR
jgi:hypothetical protein